MKTFVTLLAATVLAGWVGTARCAEIPPPPEPYPVELKVGELFEPCRSGEIACPARGPICDDGRVVAVVDTPDGIGFKGVGRGTTLCSAAGSTGFRRVFRITVK
jgi:hypothetical protein